MRHEIVFSLALAGVGCGGGPGDASGPVHAETTEDGGETLDARTTNAADAGDESTADADARVAEGGTAATEATEGGTTDVDGGAATVDAGTSDDDTSTEIGGPCPYNTCWILPSTLTSLPVPNDNNFPAVPSGEGAFVTCGTILGLGEYASVTLSGEIKALAKNGVEGTFTADGGTGVEVNNADVTPIGSIAYTSCDVQPPFQPSMAIQGPNGLQSVEPLGQPVTAATCTFQTYDQYGNLVSEQLSLSCCQNSEPAFNGASAGYCP